jgi:hypothetical protein
MKNIIYKYYIFVSSLLSGIGIFCIASGISQMSSGRWDFEPTLIGTGAAFIVGAILLYKDTKNKSK